MTNSNHSDKREADVILAESNSSLTFVNIIFAVSLGMLAFLGNKLALNSPLAVYLFMIIFSSFYSCIFYAIIAGNVARFDRLKELHRPMKIGNALSEYLGVYLIVFIFPLLISQLGGSSFIIWMAFAVDVSGFLFYTLSGFSMISRPIPSKIWQAIFTIAFVTLMVVQILAETEKWQLFRIIITACTIILLVSIMITHILKGEHVGRN